VVIDVNEKLTAFLREAAARDFELGKWDCGLWLADWYMVATGNPDPAAHLRGEHNGVLVGHVLAITKALGVKRRSSTSDSCRGDIGISRVANTARGAIFGGVFWFTPSQTHGLDTVPAESISPMLRWRVA
jgi:hypothetical protein